MAASVAGRIARTLTAPRMTNGSAYTLGQFGSGSTAASSATLGYLPPPTPATVYDGPATAAVKIAQAFTTALKNRDTAARQQRILDAQQAHQDQMNQIGLATAQQNLTNATPEGHRAIAKATAEGTAAGTPDKPDKPIAGNEPVPMPPTAIADLNHYLHAGLDPATTTLPKTHADAYAKELSQNLDYLSDRRRRAGAPSSSVELSPEATDFWANYAATTGQLPSLGMGAAGAPARMAILNRAPEVSGGTGVAANRASYKADSASLQSLQRQSDAIRAFEGTATANVGTLHQTLQHLQDAGSPLLNMPLRDAAKRFAGDPNVAAFTAALQVVNNEYARINTNPNLVGELSDAARREFRSALDPSLTMPQLERVVEVLALDAHNRRQMTDATLQTIRSRIRGDGASADGGAGDSGGAATHVYNPTTGRVEPIGGR